MRVFVTGSTGFIGSAVVRELQEAGHQVLGLVRSDANASALAETGAEVHRGSLDDLDSLRAGAAATDGVIHTAFNHDFTDIAAAAATDLAAVEAIGEVLVGSGRPLVIASGVGALHKGRPSVETDVADSTEPMARRMQSEVALLALAERGVRTSAVRLPPSVHGEGDHGLVPRLIQIARDKGVSAHPGDGENRWSAVHRLDAARLFRLALENSPAGRVYHAIGDQGVPVRDIADAIGRHLGLPVTSVARGDEAVRHFGWLGAFFGNDVQSSSALTQQWLGWRPTGVGLLADLEQGHYFKAL
ncbi:SDR family oxidoreductase [Kutzneria buriramensis]|uniref:Nucleoside-diphosphate-sugar epimerase n=1 Tax=Kutzneria buriramensis TaxID=1045776 RepID=A0A3E0H194_9PSEU|nr:SDR family oxidoreductase [Kutzneria buriramensis]REH36296.1 nucleoside-diphosphate-sugar epimerase [Kutzneria buriramensis]